jgi:NTP pyrophosphatase (non-canonical NTP hydrolase)
MFQEVFLQIQDTNVRRANRWHSKIGGLKSWSILEWAGAMCGEAGELANVAKKIRRLEMEMESKDTNTRQTDKMADLQQKFGEECADVFIYLSLCAARQNIDLAWHIREKFNHTSEKYGFPETL